jgi:putative DNA primase/helicase
MTNGDADNDAILKKYDQYINKSSSDSILRRALNASKNSLLIELGEFDSDPYLLNCRNGVFDLRKLSFRQAKAQDYLTLSMDCAYLPENLAPRCERWYSFIDEITSHDKEKANYLQKALGYSLLGENTKECMFVAYGSTTRNGKGTLFNTIAKVFGLGKENGYGGTIKPALICESKYKERDYNAPEPMLADTVGLRYLTMSETKDNVSLDETSIKSLTGRDPLKTRQLHSPAFVFTPQFTLWLSTNFLPRVNDDSVFRSDRIWVIPFNEHFDENTRDEQLKDIFTNDTNKVTILRWLIEGYKKFVKEGLTPPQCVRDATAEYARLNDRILCFKEDCLEYAEGETVSNALMYAKYKSWCADDERDYTPLGTTTFYKKIGKFYKRKDSNGFRGFVDVKVRHSDNNIVIK